MRAPSFPRAALLLAAGCLAASHAAAQTRSQPSSSGATPPLGGSKPATSGTALVTPPLESFPPAARAALDAAYRAAAARPDAVEAVGRWAMTLHAWEQWQAAEAAYRRVQELAPQAYEWPYLAALVAMRTGRSADAVALLDRTLTLAPTFLAARVKLAEALSTAGDLTRSAEVYAALVKEPAAQPEAEYGLGRLAAAQGRWPEAITHHQRACELFPEFGAAHYALALAYRKVGKLDEAQRELAAHRQYGPRWPAIDDPVLARVQGMKDDARAQLERGIRLGNEGKIGEAIAAHDAALARNPSIAQAHANLISLHGRLGQWVQAESHYKTVVGLKSNLDEAHYNYGVVLGLQRRDAEAAEAFRQAIAVNPFHAQAHNNLGVLLERERRWEDAASAYRQAVESQPAFRLGRFNLARMLIVLTRYDEAVAELERLLARDGAAAPVAAGSGAAGSGAARSGAAASGAAASGAVGSLTVAFEDADTAKDAPRYVFALATAHLRAGRGERGLEYAREARRLALASDQPALAAAIDKELAAIGARP